MPPTESKLATPQLSASLRSRLCDVLDSTLQSVGKNSEVEYDSDAVVNGTCLAINGALTGQELLGVATRTVSGHVAALRITPGLVSHADSECAVRLRSLANVSSTLFIADW